MGIFASIKKIDKNFGWSFLGFVLAAIFGALSLYTEFWKETVPRLEFEILSNAPVLDVKEKIPDLEVFYQTQDIAKSGQTLSILLVRAINRGSANLLGSYYDSKAPIGFDIAGGTLIRADLSDTSNAYLNKAAGVIAKDSTVTIEPVILERGEWFIVKLLVLHKIGAQPSISTHGKIAGMHNLPVVSTIASTEKESFWYKAYSGSVWTQIVRIPSYFLGAILIILAIVIPVSSISEALTSRKRRKLVEQFKTRTKLSLNDADEFIFDRFIRNGMKHIQRLTNLVADPERLQKRVAEHLKEEDQIKEKFKGIESDEEKSIEDDVFAPYYNNMQLTYIKLMIKHGFIAETEGKWAVVADRLKIATSFIEYVELVGAKNV